MARGRLILRTLGSSRKFAEARIRGAKLGEFCQALYPLLVANSDDYGRLSGDAFTVKLVVFPSSPRSEPDFDAALNALNNVGLIVRYVANSRQVIQVVDFDKGQPNLHKRSMSDFPECSGKIPENPAQLNGRELKRTEPNPTTLCVVVDGFQNFWSVYPKKRSKSDAEKAWRKLAPSPELCQRIQESIAAQRVTPDWAKDDGKYIPFPATWLNGRRWEDTLEIERQPPHTELEPDWFEECQTLHGGSCGGRLRHHNRKLIEAQKAKAAAS